MRSPPPRMCVPIFWGRGYLYLRCLSREDFPIMHVFCKKSNGYQLPRSRGVQFPQDRGGGGGSGDEERAKVPLILGKWVGGVRGDNSDSFDKHVSPLIAFSHWLLCFGAILQFFIFDLVIVQWMCSVMHEFQGHNLQLFL